MRILCWQHAKINTPSWLLWMAIVCPLGRPITLALVPEPKHTKLLILGFWIAQKHHFRPEYNCPTPGLGDTVWLELACLPGMHFDLDSFPMAGSLPSVDSGFLNFSKRPLQAWETSVWTWMSSICQIWPNSSDGCPLWAAIARPPEVLLAWILFYLLDNCKLLIMDVEIFEKVHWGPEIWPSEKLWRNPPLLPQFWDQIDGYPL